MVRIVRFLSVFVLILYLGGSHTHSKALAETIRNPVYAGSFYPEDAVELIRTIETLTEQARKNSVELPKNRKLRALIFPHAGYIYSGLTAAHAGRAIEKKRFSKVILMGPDHRVGFRNIAISDRDAFKTPLGVVHLHPDAAGLRKNSDLFNSVPLSDQKEHSLEVVLPFLQYHLSDFTLIPMVMGPGDITSYASALESIGISDSLLVASSDLSHYLSYDDAIRTDKDTIQMIINLQYESFRSKKRSACGKIPIMVLMNLAKKHKWQPMLLHYSNSGDTAGSRDRVVGYAAIAFYEEKQMTDQTNKNLKFSEEKGQVLVKLARQTIGKELKQDISEVETLESELNAPDFQQPRGTFVTLHKNGQLRGCIGSLTASEPLVESVRHNAINAAFRDPRFSPLSIEELDHVDIEVSILTQPRPLAYEDGNDLMSKLRVNVDGVILRKGHHTATFLPQVWEQLPNPQDFLSHLCRKAGLPSDAWQTTKLEVSTYQVEYFEEK